MHAELVDPRPGPPQATSEQARQLTDRIKVAVDGTWLLIQEAYTTRAWSALGYASWDDYCTREFGTSRLRLPREERQEVVASLREIGMSQRAIASATGESRRTVQRALTGGANEPPAPRPEPVLSAGSDPDGLDLMSPVAEDHGSVPSTPAPPLAPRPVTGTDGKTYPVQRKASADRRPPLPPQFCSTAADLGRVIARIERLQADDRYRANRQPIADQCLPEIRRAASVLHDLLLDLGHDSGDPP